MTTSTQPKHFIVYVDDDPDDLDFVQEAIRLYTKDVDLLAFDDSTEALHFFQALSSSAPKPCLIILDMNMPLLNGLDLLKKIQSLPNLASCPVVFFTTSSLPHDRFLAESQNAGFITKPLTISQMKAIANQFLEHCSAEIRSQIRRLS